MLRSRLPLAFAALCSVTAQAVPPVATPDSYSTAEDAPLTVSAAGGVLANDTATGTSIEAQLVAGPQHGTLTLAADGSLTYTPAANYSGPDSFTYRARNVIPPVLFTIDNTQSKIQIDAKLTSDYGTSTSKDSSRVQGTVAATFAPSLAPFTQAHVVDMDAVLVDAIDLQFKLGCLFGICAATIDAHSRVAAGEQMTLSMNQAGPAVGVASNLFSQTGNTFDLAGIIDVSASGAAAGAVPTGPQTINSTSPLDLNNCVITSSGGTLTLKIPVDFAGRFYMDPATPTTNYIDLKAQTAFTGSSGYIIATAPASANVAEESATVTVNLTVTPVNDLPVAVAKNYVMTQGTTLSVPATATAATSELIAAGAQWKWHYQGFEPTDWKRPNFNDAAWASGAGELGFGDTADGRPEATNIRPGTTPNHRTAYFRRHFTVASLPVVTGLRAEMVCDDGAVIHVNGVEATRVNLPPSPEAIAYGTLATVSVNGTAEADYVSYVLDPALLLEGDNVIAVEVHQQSDTSSDLSFDLRLKVDTGAQGLLAGATDVDTPLTSLAASILRTPGRGTATVQANGAFTYTPAPSFSGTDTFVFRVTDGFNAQTDAQALVPTGATWKYQATGADEGTAWRSTTFDDTAWPAGPAELGYGDAADGRPEATNIRPDTATPIHATYYFRHTFTPTVDPALVTSITGRVLRDDAAAVYLNGTEVYRDSTLPANATYTTLATAGTPSETDYQSFNVPLSLLRTGPNVLAVEVHQSSLTSSDVSFDLGLTAQAVAGARVTIAVRPDDQDGDGMSDIWERAYGLDYLSAADASQDLDGDGISNADEYLADTHPGASAAALRPAEVAVGTDTLSLSFSGVSTARWYQLETSPDLATWTLAGGKFRGVPGQPVTVPKPSAPLYYRLVVSVTGP